MKRRVSLQQPATFIASKRAEQAGKSRQKLSLPHPPSPHQDHRNHLAVETLTPANASGPPGIYE